MLTNYSLSTTQGNYYSYTGMDYTLLTEVISWISGAYGPYVKWPQPSGVVTICEQPALVWHSWQLHKPEVCHLYTNFTPGSLWHWCCTLAVALHRLNSWITRKDIQSLWNIYMRSLKNYGIRPQVSKHTHVCAMQSHPNKHERRNIWK